MRLILTTIFLFLSIKSFSQNDYKIQINDTILEISLDKQYNITLDKKEIQFKIISKDTLIYNDDLFSFNYSKDYKVSQTIIDEGIKQFMIMTAEGSGILIQKYSTINPTMLNEMMIAEVTKESLNYGFTLQREDYSRNLKSGQKIDVDKAILTYKDETNIYEVATIGEKDEGILIMTMIMDKTMSKQGKKIIELMWNSLTYKK
ncbi:hypothetical protein [Mangrovimonas spongiae]|uniref:Uncharacterized protein n=1 Tax=Mangrovimonas spongiae TaxID=2494697 RepID=A0A3R9MIQ0_9FLAO|nr:hypothetical protein [Mangrovimonas spongiae]RSK41346.1 hypothetical protein EJA19_00290 [Mangrovimonas spongiae]